ncbi:C39 family peptidase [Pseudoxanthomonas daejeonensis]|uniref:Peptidase n=1 Tax=Pseudoxanthomonas daejeonensis TaxID=266062 RepID=A0ABQ6ZC10_9GAMM|nr:C39 family peptidase [Pseudoxanthomonas daejeonensis]KAF1697556.1 peptidase [Pseudoxanthomonas daejeonensis]
MSRPVLPSLALTLVVLALQLAPAQPARAADVAFAGVLPNGALYHTPVESMRESRFRNLVRQQTDYSCAAASLATILRHAYHLDADENTVIEGMLAMADADVVRERGFSLLDIKRYVESLGMRGRGYRVDEDKLRSLRVPSLVLMDVNGFRHFVVLKQIIGDQVEIGDPILGNRVMPLPVFLEAWPSRAVFVVIGTDFDRNTVLLQPSSKPSARALYARQGPITDAELLDFGFSHADLF